MTSMPERLTRRESLARMSASALGMAFPACASLDSGRRREPKSVAAIITWYIPGSHADVLIGKILEGWKQDGGLGPDLKLASMYIDQFPKADLARKLSKKYGVPIFDTIEEALTVGTQGIPVDAVISVGEHGDYPWNEKDQHLYPRRRFWKEITDTFEKYGRVVPVFNDKHFGPEWDDVVWMYERGKEMNIPMMAGSSQPLSFRTPNVTVPMGCEIEAAVGVGYSGLDIYGFHTLEVFQAFVERRSGAETGVKWVQWFGPDKMWDVVDSGVVRRDLLEAALEVIPKDERRHTFRELRETVGDSVGLFLFEYNDGLLGAVFMLARHAVRIGLAVQVRGQSKPVATFTHERVKPRHPHFAYLLKAIEQMVHTGAPAYPVERTYLTSGILDRVLTSRFEGGKRLDTPELAIPYTPVDYPWAPLPKL